MVIKRIVFIASLLFGQLCFAQLCCAQRPNIVLIMADDMGYSDIGCYGSEIPTPNLDRLAQKGVKFRHFYNAARCCPTRASLMTGLFPHQTGIGHMTEEPGDPSSENWGTPGYQGYLNRNCVTMAEVLGGAGYHTYMSGKWHLGFHGEEKWPLQRGFEKYYGILAGAASYFKPQGGRGLTYNNTKLPTPEGAYYTTDAFTDSAIAFVDGQKDERPFFLYLAYNAPHWPLQAKEEDIKKFEGVYDKGWDVVREQRFARQKQLGIVDARTTLSPRDPGVRPWAALSSSERKEVAYRMQVYAAQVSCIDQNVGKVVRELEKQHKLDNTVIIFLSDNGACPEPYKELGGGTMAEINDGSKSGAISYGMGWANASNTPYRKWKTEVEEGGMSAPFVVSWPKGMGKSPAGAGGNAGGAKIVDTPFYLIDVLPTMMDWAKAKYPAQYKGNTIQALEGKSFAAVLKGTAVNAHPWMYWEHQGNEAIRRGRWKAVKDHDKKEWELFDLVVDRTEEKDVAVLHPELVKEMAERWEEWAKGHAVLPKRVDGGGKAAGVSAGANANVKARPNVLYISIDDLNDYMSLLQGFPGLKTPNLERFAKTAMTFTRAYCAAPVCNPSRAAILSGVAPYRTGVYDNDNNIQNSSAILETTFIPEHFKANGYTTITRGKIYHTRPPKERYAAMWDVDGGQGDYGPYPTERNVPTTVRAPVNFNYQPWTGGDGDHPDNVTADFFIAELSKSFDKPFFMTCGLYKPHNPWTAPKRWFDLYPLDSVVLPKVLDSDWDDLPPMAKKWASNPVDYEALKASGKWKEVVRSYLACLSFMDWNLGRILDALEASRYRGNTIVCLFGDNGFHLGEKQHFAKYALWEQTTHILHMWRVPGMTAPGSVCRRTVNLLDIYPTLDELCGLPAPKQRLDGESITALLRDPAAGWDHPAITTYKEGNQSIRTEQYRFIHYADGGEELYDDIVDPLEWKNLINDPAKQGLIVNFRKQLSTQYTPAVGGKGGVE